MPRITVAGGITDKRVPPVSTAGPSVDEMLRKPTPVDPEPAVPGADTAGGTAGESGDSTAAVPAPAEPSNAEVRAWAAENYDGDVSASGPIPKAVREAYDAAHTSED